MQVNNIYLHGSFVHRKKDDKTFPWTQKKFMLCDNKITLKKNTFTLSLTKNIREVLEINDLSTVLEELFRKEIGTRVRNLSWRISNIHESITIKCTPRKILSDLLVKIRDEIGISVIQLTQEQNRPLAANLNDVISHSDHLTYIALKFTTLNRSATTKIQLGKDRLTAEITVIISKFNEESMNLIRFLETYCQQHAIE